MPEDTPQGPAPDLDAAIDALQARLGETTTILNIVAGLQRSATRLKPVLADELRAVRAAIDAVLPLLPLAAVVLIGAIQALVA